MRRLLTPGGRLIVPVDHPFVSHALAGPWADYFATCKWSEQWTFGGQGRPDELLAPAANPHPHARQ